MTNFEKPSQSFEIGNKEKDTFENRLRELVKPRKDANDEPLTHFWEASYNHEDTRVFFRVQDTNFNFETNPPLGMEPLDFIKVVIEKPVLKKDNGVTSYIQTEISLNPYTRNMELDERSFERDKKGRSTESQVESGCVDRLPSMAGMTDRLMEEKFGIHTVTHDKFEEVMEVLNALEPKENNAVTLFKRLKGRDK